MKVQAECYPTYNRNALRGILSDLATEATEVIKFLQSSMLRFT